MNDLENDGHTSVDTPYDAYVIGGAISSTSGPWNRPCFASPLVNSSYSLRHKCSYFEDVWVRAEPVRQAA